MFFLIILLLDVLSYEKMFPLDQCAVVRVTSFDADFYGSSCGFGRGTDTEPHYKYIAAPNYPFRETARPCGVCYELTGPEGSVRVMVSSGCPDCEQDMLHFDLSLETFPLIVDTERGIGSAYVTYREVSCDTDGPVKFRWKAGSNKWSFYILVFNHRVGVETLEVLQNEEWINMKREYWNEFYFSGEAVLPLTFRVTSFYDDAIEVTVDEILPETIVSFPRQFEVPAQLYEDYDGSCCAPQDIHSIIYEDELKGCWADWSGFVEDLECTDNPHSGTNCISADFSAWDGFGYGCNAEARADQYEYLEFWARSDLETYDGLNIRFSSGKYDELHIAVVEGITNEWKKFQVPVASEIEFFSFSKITWKNEKNVQVTLFVDDIILTANAEAPSIEKCAPGVSGGPDPIDENSSIINGVWIFSCILFLWVYF